MNAAVFLDRDNTIIHNDGDLGDPSKVRLIQGAASAVASLKGLGYKIIVVSNQGGVARGKFAEADVDAVNHRINELIFANSGVAIDRFYYCPYHPEGTVDRYRREHPWRKPKPGMLLQAARDFGLDLRQSWIIGDQMRDVHAGFTARTIPILLLERGDPPGPTAAVSPDAAEDRVAAETVLIEPARDYFVVRNLVEAVRMIGQKARPANVAAAMKAQRVEVVSRTPVRVSTSVYDPNMVNELGPAAAAPRDVIAEQEIRKSGDLNIRKAADSAGETLLKAGETTAVDEQESSLAAVDTGRAPMADGDEMAAARETDESAQAPHTALPEQAVEARGQIEELIASAGVPRRQGMMLRASTAAAVTAAATAPALTDVPASATESNDAAGDPALAPSRSSRESRADGSDGRLPSSASSKRRGRSDSRKPPRSAEMARQPDEPAPKPSASRSPAPAAAQAPQASRAATGEEPAATGDDGSPAPPSMEHTLRQILQELRNQRNIGGEFSSTTVVAIVLQMMVIVAVAAALLMGAGNSDLFLRWMACAIVLQLATLTMLLFRRP